MGILAVSRFSGDATNDLPMPRGFTGSAFNPMVYSLASDCLTRIGSCEGLAVVLTSMCGDIETTDMASRLLVAGQVHNPRLFGQSVPTSVLGKVAADFQIEGPVVTASSEDPAKTVRTLAELMISTNAASRVLAMTVELARSDRGSWALLPQGRDILPVQDRGAACVIECSPEGVSTKDADALEAHMRWTWEEAR